MNYNIKMGTFDKGIIDKFNVLKPCQVVLGITTNPDDDSKTL